MSEHSQQSRTNAESTENNERQTRTEHVERSDVGVSLGEVQTRDDAPYFITGK